MTIPDEAFGVIRPLPPRCYFGMCHDSHTAPYALDGDTVHRYRPRRGIDEYVRPRRHCRAPRGGAPDPADIERRARRPLIGATPYPVRHVPQVSIKVLWERKDGGTVFRGHGSKARQGCYAVSLINGN